MKLWQKENNTQASDWSKQVEKFTIGNDRNIDVLMAGFDDLSSEEEQIMQDLVELCWFLSLSLSMYLPAGHTWQSAEPFIALKLPFPQTIQAASELCSVESSPSSRKKVPSGHEEQC